MAAWDDPVAHIRGLERRLAAVEALAETWQGSIDAAAITYQDAVARERATGWLQNVVRHLRAALETP